MATTTPTTTGTTSTTTGTTQGTTSTPLPSVTPTQTSTPTQSPTDTPTNTPTDTPTDTTTPSSGGSTSNTFTYSSANTSVATVSSGGKITAKGNGTTVITVKYPGLSDKQVKVNVLTYVTAVSITGSKSVSTGSKIVLSPKFSPSNASDKFKTGTWTSSDTNVATVDSNGNVTGKSKGTATIKYKTTTGTAYEGSYAITVNTSTATLSVTYGTSKLEAVSLTYRDGIGTYQLNVAATPSNLSYTFESSNTNIAAVSSSGVVTIKGAGTVSVGAKFAGNSTYTACSDYVAFTIAKGTQTASISGSSTVTAGKTIQLTGTGKGTLSWTSNNTAVATVNASSGLVTGKSAGTATITLTAAGNTNFNSDTATKQITVSAASSALSVSYYHGSSYLETVELSYRDNIGTYQLTVSNPNNLQYSYKTSNSSVATVSTNGTVSIKGVGTANVYAYFEGNSYYTACEDYVTFKVNKGTQSLSISGNSSVNAGGTLQLTASGAKGTTSWKSSAESYATVSSVGLVTGKSAGKTTITLTSAATSLFEAKSVTKEITVNRNAQTFTISNASLSLTYGGTSTLTYSGAKTGVTWSSSNTSIATVGSTTGKVTAKGVGTAKITATAAQTGTYSSYTKSCDISVSKANTSITLKDKNGNAAENLTFTYNPAGQVYQLTYFISDGVNPLNWTTSNASVVSLDNAYYGKLTIGSAGTATVKAYFDGNNYYNASNDTITITVNKASQTPSISGNSSVNAGSTITLTGSGQGTKTWSSDNTSVATVNSSTGVVTGVAAGTAKITLSCAGNTNYNAGSNYKTITVNSNSQTFTISNTSLSLAYGGTSTLTYSGAKTAVTWKSSNTSIATVGSTTGKVTATGIGTTTITATAAASGTYSSYTKQCSVTVGKANTTITLKDANGNATENLTFTYKSGGQVYQLTYFISDAITNPQWSSTTPSVATFDTAYYGKLIIGNAGTTTVKTYFDGNNYYNASSDTMSITVNKASQTPTISGTTTVTAGSTTTLTGSGYGTKSWSSNNTSVATVNASTGVVTGVSYGTATITLSCAGNTNYNAGTKTATVTVNRASQTFTISNASLSLAYGGTSTLTYSGAKTGVTWKSSNTSIATVGSTTGKVTATGVGTATITATAATTGTYSSYAKQCNVTVSKANTSITLKDKDSKAVSGLTFTYKPGGQQYQLTYFISDGVNPLNWTTTNTSVVSLDNGYYGKLTIGSAGSASVKAYFDGNNYYNASSYTLPITVNKASQTISWNATKTPINIDSTYTFKVSGNATGIHYSSSNTSVATVNASSGLVTGVSYGTAIITAYAVGNTNYNASAKITKEIKISKLSQTLSKTSTVTSVNVGNTIQLSVSGCNTSLSWRSGSTGVATVNASTGVVTGVTGGSARIYVKAISGAKYNESSEIYFDITVNKLSQTVTASASPTTIYTNTSPTTSTISVTQGQGTPTYEITSGASYGTLAGNVLTAKASGTVKVKVTCAGNDKYLAGSTTVSINVTYKSSGGGSSPSNPDPVTPGGSSDPSGSSTPSASPTETPSATPSSSDGATGNYGVDIDGHQFYQSGSCQVDDTKPSISGLGGAYVSWIDGSFTTSSCPLSASKTSAAVGVWSPNVASKTVGNESFRVTVTLSGSYTSTAPNQNSGGSTTGPTSTSSPS